VNNAAFQLHVSRFEDLTEAHFDRTMKTNLYGYFHMSQETVPHMKRGGAIVNTGSVTGIMGNKNRWITRPPRAAFMPSPGRCRPISFHVGFGSMRWRRARSARR